MNDAALRMLELSTVLPNGCWLPKSGTRTYRRIKIDGKTYRAIRVITGAVDGQVVRHECDNPWCCNPEHLVVGTQSDNMADMNYRGRHPRRKLSDEDVIQILQSDASGYSLAKKYGVAKEIIYRIRKGEIYVRLQQRVAKPV